MLSKLATLVKSKAAAAVLGVLLVGGGGSAVALAASQGHLNGVGLQMAASQKQASGKAGDNSGSTSRAHAEGMLTACSATSIQVKDEHQGTVTFTVNKDTRFNGHIHGNDSNGATSASKPAFTIDSLCKLVNKVKVQVRGTAATSGGKTTKTATKVTVQGPGTANAGSEGSGGSDMPGMPSDVTTPSGHGSGHANKSHHR